MRLTVALITFVFGVLATIGWTVYYFSSTEKSKAPRDYRSSGHGSNTSFDVPTVAFCHLLANPTEYNQRVIRTRAVLIINAYVRSLYDPSCLTKEPMVGIELDPSFQYEVSDKVQREVFDLLRGEGEPKEESARVTIIGRFTGPILPKGSVFIKDNSKKKYQYQHLFNIMRLERAEPESPNKN